ncbi:DUF58 domain-containing protein [Paramicrobacterium agarici]|uniref:DUF58 domain-containing protein n=1 Tax=Paramicrobacterium agarici TaxID=630514 RepID=UPI00114EFEE5|nr:DUF58 domain-containing protein [Microbacterium agarici]TQO21429.1 uncharacterized protein (DUF58 family) [Microbacterium agarici]
MSARTLRLTRRGWALAWASAVILVLTILLTRREGLFIASFLAIVVVLCALMASRQRVPLHVGRRVPSDAHCGERVDIVCEIQAAGSSSAVTGWTDAVPRSFGSTPHGVMPPQRLARGGRTAVRYTVVPSVRGWYDVGPFQVTVSDPLGACESSRPVGETSRMLVLPRVSPLAPSDLLASAGEGRRRDRTRPTAPRADELIARDYRPGDPLRRVHWRATARHGQLMVRQEEPQADPEALLLLDVAPGQTRIDALVDMAASLAVHVAGMGYRVTFAESDSSWVTTQPSDIRDVLTALAVWPGGTLDAEREVALRIEQRFSDSIPIFVLTTDADRLSALTAIAVRAAPAIAFVATGSGLDQDAVPAPWIAAGLADRVDVSASWERLHRRVAHVR